MYNNEAATISRATSVSRASKHGSTASRNQSLIKKNVAPQDLRPSDILIERFVSWKAIVKQLISYFEGVADIENNIAKEYTKLGAVIQVPFRSGNQFLGEGGLQVWKSSAPLHSTDNAFIRTYITAFVTKHASSPTNMQTWVEPSIVPSSNIYRNCMQKSKRT
jgi:hypothetical protein